MIIMSLYTALMCSYLGLCIGTALAGILAGSRESVYFLPCSPAKSWHAQICMHACAPSFPESQLIACICASGFINFHSNNPGFNSSGIQVYRLLYCRAVFSRGVGLVAWGTSPNMATSAEVAAEDGPVESASPNTNVEAVTPISTSASTSSTTTRPGKITATFGDIAISSNFDSGKRHKVRVQSSSTVTVCNTPRQSSKG